MKLARPIALLLLFILLCASLAYWGMQLFQPTLRLQAPLPERLPANISAATTLFGGNLSVAASSSYQLKGIVNADNDKDSAAIIAINGKPARPIRIGAELNPGVTIQEVHQKYVLFSENGVSRRLDLSEIQKKTSDAGIASANRPTPQNQPQLPSPSVPNTPSRK